MRKAMSVSKGYLISLDSQTKNFQARRIYHNCKKRDTRKEKCFEN